MKPTFAEKLDMWEKLFRSAIEWKEILESPVSLKYEAMLELIAAARPRDQEIERLRTRLAALEAAFKIERLQIEIKVQTHLENGVMGKGLSTEVYPDWVYDARRALLHAESNIPWLDDLRQTLEWQGGTIHQMLSCVQRLVAESKEHEAKRKRGDDAHA